MFEKSKFFYKKKDHSLNPFLKFRYNNYPKKWESINIGKNLQWIFLKNLFRKNMSYF
jgi:hypothetical protein